MNPLPMPSEVRQGFIDSGGKAPPRGRLLRQLFLVPMLIVLVAVAIMIGVGRLSGGAPSLDEALDRLRHPGGQRTAGILVGPAAKQRYIDAKALVDGITAGLSLAGRADLSTQIIDILDHHTQADEGDVRHFLLLALGRTWQVQGNAVPNQESATAMSTLLRYAEDPDITTRTAAILGCVYFRGRGESSSALPVLIAKLRDSHEDLDVRIASATALGPLASSNDVDAIAALRSALAERTPENVELTWSAALSLAQLNQPEATEQLLVLLDRTQLGQARVIDHDHSGPISSARALSEPEIERILINAMLGGIKLQSAPVRQAIEHLAASDSSSRVREAGREILAPAASARPVAAGIELQRSM